MVEGGVVHQVGGGERGKSRAGPRVVSLHTDTSTYSELGPNIGPAHLDSFDDGMTVETTHGTTKTAWSTGTGNAPARTAKLRQHSCVPASGCLRHTLVLVM